jgi:hypothetical protein
MMGRRPPVKAAGGDDVVTFWRRLLSFTQRPGVTSKVKRAIRRHERHQARQAIRNDEDR